MQEASGNRKSTQPGWPVLQLQIRRHSFLPFRHFRRCASRAAGFGFAARNLFVISGRGRLRAKPVGDSMPGAFNDIRIRLRLSSRASKRSDGRLNVRNSSLSIESGRWIIRANPDGLQ